METTFGSGRRTGGLVPVGDVVEALADHVSEGFLVADRSGRIVRINAPAELLFGYEPEELQGQPVELLFPDRFPLPPGDGAPLRDEVQMTLPGRNRHGSPMDLHIDVTFFQGRDRLLAATFIRPTDEVERSEPPPGAVLLPERRSSRSEPELVEPPTPRIVSFPSFASATEEPPAPFPDREPPPAAQADSPPSPQTPAAGPEAPPLYDPLTGLPGKVLFMVRLNVALARTSRRSSSVALLVLDVDEFHVVNDRRGRGAGDRLLVAVAERLFGALHPGDTVARLGPDEFALLCDDIAKDADAALVAERVHGTASGSFAVDEEEIPVSLSIGWAMGSGPDDTPDSLLRKAEVALERARRGGGNRIEPHEPATAPEIPAAETAVVREPQAPTLAGPAEVRPDSAAPRAQAPSAPPVRAESRLGMALDRGEFRLLYQPVIRLRTGRIAGVEALLRWEDPDRGLIPPSAFLAEAEETGLIVDIGAWVLEQVVLDAERLQAARPEGPPLMLAVNLSARQLAQPGFTDIVHAILAGSRVDAGTLYLEVSESNVMKDADATMSVLRDLRSIGARMSIDDFGTGYSSLVHLKRFPVDFLKVDRSFVSGVVDDPADSAIVSAVIGIGHALGLPVIAEGVETDEQLGTLRRLGCDLAQGYRFARPEPVIQVCDMLRGDPAW